MMTFICHRSWFSSWERDRWMLKPETGTAAGETKVLYLFPAPVNFKWTEERSLCYHYRPRDAVLTPSCGVFLINMIKMHFLSKKKLNIQILITGRWGKENACSKSLPGSPWQLTEPSFLEKYFLAITRIVMPWYGIHADEVLPPPLLSNAFFSARCQISVEPWIAVQYCLQVMKNQLWWPL